MTSATAGDPQPPNTQDGSRPGDLHFPADFVWGAATASFQIEGAANEGGRAPSIWDTFCRVPGAVANGDNGDVACDHWHRWPEDVDLMRSLNLGAYRFSTAWPRVCPEPGVVNHGALDVYSRLVDGLLEAGITPWVTLYHWDLPQYLEDRGGWGSRETAEHMVDYALAMHGALGDRVSMWTTLNEPWCSAFLGYAGGQHAPGRQEPQTAINAAHHLLLAHGQVTRALRTADPTAKVGVTLNMNVADPANPADEADLAAARRHDALQNRVFAEPVFQGRYPDDALAAWATVGVEPPVQDGDFDIISTPIDFLGINYYNSVAVSAVPPETERALPGGAVVERPTSDPMVGGENYAVSRGLPRTAMGWEIDPEGLSRLLRRVHHDWSGPAGIPTYVTENGSAFDDEVSDDGTVTDPERVAYLRNHLRAVHEALSDGVDVRGYFAWSLMDNFEWAYGYDKRFGIVRVDFETQKRTPKASAFVYADVARTSTLSEGGTVAK